MVDPHFLDGLNSMYEQSLKKYMEDMGMLEQPQEQKQEDENPIRGIDNLPNVLTTADLVRMLSNQLSAGNYGILCVTGMQGSGKSSLARSISHIMHSELGYKIIYVSGYDVMEAPERLVAEAGDAKKLFVVIDDASYTFNSVSGVQANRVKQFFGIIRHALAGSKVCICPITHVVAGIPPILRNSNAFVFSAPTLQEFDIMSKLTGRSEAAKEALGSVFNFVTKVQGLAAKNRNVTITYGKYEYPMRWGVNGDAGDGRLMVSIISGKAHVYRSVEQYCDVCKDVGYNVKFNPRNYTSKKKAEEKDKKDGDHDGHDHSSSEEANPK